MMFDKSLPSGSNFKATEIVKIVYEVALLIFK